MTETQTQPTLVLGGTGKTGRRVARRLSSLGRPVRIGSRAGLPPFDWQDQDTWASVLAGVGSVYLSYHRDLAAPGVVVTVAGFGRLAVECGVPRLVMLAGRGEPEAEAAEQAVRDRGAAVTVLRSAWFSQNFIEDYLLQPVLAGEVALPAADTAEPFIDARDIADVAVAALTNDTHLDDLYELTGNRLLTFADAVTQIAAATGRQIHYLPVTIEEYAAAATEQGVPPEVVGLLSYLFGEVLDGRNAHLSNGLRRALGREPRDFADFTRATAVSGAWDVPVGSGVDR